MITSKQRATLRSMANTLEPILYVGKGGVTENVIKQADEALEARELVKGSVQQNAGLDAKEVCAELAERTGGEAISAVGRKFVLYRESIEHKKIEL